jgi:protease IV
MPRRKFNRASLETALHRLGVGARNALSLLPGERPEWIVLDLSGTFPARRQLRGLLGFPLPPDMRVVSLEELQETFESLADARWLKGLILRIDGLHVDPATAHALRGMIDGLKKAGKKTVAYLTQITWMPYYVATAADEVVAPESAEVSVHGLGVTMTFMRDALAKVGVRFEKLAIDEYKNAFDQLVRQEMSPAQREQYDALLASLEETFVSAIALARGKSVEDVRAFVDEGVTSAKRAHELGMINRLAYEDELFNRWTQSLAEAERFMKIRSAPVGAPRVAVITLLGAIMTGKSRRSPLPIPMGVTSGSETLVRALRVAEADEHTAAIVLYVDSGGGSALASDLIWREVRRIKAKKPIVAVMGAVAASGGYYVLTHANRVLAAPTTITGSIGVLTGKLVLEDFYARYGFHPEAIQRGRFALLHSPAAAFTDDQRKLLRRGNEEVYQRFIARVAEGRGMTTERVNEIGRGHIWSGAEALKLGLVDELGGVQEGIERACELAGIPRGGAVWNVRAPANLLLPTAEDPTTIARTLEPFQREHTFLLHPAWLEIA